jgi:hypothetical protein
VFVLPYRYALNKTPISINCCDLRYSVVSAAASGGQMAVLSLSCNFAFALCVLFHYPYSEKHRDSDFLYRRMRNDSPDAQFFPFDSMACAGTFAAYFSCGAI